MEPPIALPETFHYTSATHTYAIRWTALARRRWSRCTGSGDARIVWGILEDRWIPVETAEWLRQKLNARGVELG